MIEAIKIVVDTIEEMQDIEAIIDDYTVTRQRLREDIKNHLETAAGADNVLMNDINDLSCISREEGIYLGLYYGIKLSNLINNI